MIIFALVGKPNVGKSTLFNRLCRKHIAIVHEEPGVTRDRNTAIIDYKDYHFILVDTGGFEPDVSDTIPKLMRQQSQLAVEEADAILFLLDRKAGWTIQDQSIYSFLRKSEKPVYFIVNKVDGESHESEAAEFYESGAEEVFTISAAHGRGLTDLFEKIARDFPEIKEKDKKEAAAETLSISIIGRPNVGKSSLTNRFLQVERQIVHDEPGTTRDPVDHLIQFRKRPIRLIDTAGIQKKSRVSQLISKYSMIASIRSIERSDVVLLVLDATLGVVEQDARIAGYILERGKSLVILVNKWDLIEKDSTTLEKMRAEIFDKLAFLTFAPIIFVSAKSGQRVTQVMDKVLEVYGQYSKRIQTSDLNKIIQTITARHSPPSKGKNRTKIFYSTQVTTCPPTFIITSNHPETINVSYQRYVANQFRQYFGFEGTPIRIFFRDKSKNQPERSV
ncbi:MAG: ribosome biogenesis GTPase Der [Deltaproteobacteria bacterium]|nr:ribosome biogenesis GTPase Der [Deltaproteobacteria bacterium]